MKESDHASGRDNDFILIRIIFSKKNKFTFINKKKQLLNLEIYSIFASPYTLLLYRNAKMNSAVGSVGNGN